MLSRCLRLARIGHIWTRLDTFRQNHSPLDDSRGGNGQKSRESCGLAVCRQEERQHRHDYFKEQILRLRKNILEGTGSVSHQEAIEEHTNKNFKKDL